MVIGEVEHVLIPVVSDSTFLNEVFNRDIFAPGAGKSDTVVTGVDRFIKPAVEFLVGDVQAGDRHRVTATSKQSQS